MERTVAKYLSHEIYRHKCACGAEYGYCGEHRAFRVVYQCECGAPVRVEQCAAWPVTDKDCPACYRPITCEMLQARTSAVLR